MTTPEQFLSDAIGDEIDWGRQPGYPVALQPEFVQIGSGPDGFEVAFARAVNSGVAPKADEVRSLWKARWNRRAAPVALVVTHQDTAGEWKASVCGTKDDPAVIGGLPLDQVDRIVTAALSSPDAATADRTFHRLLVGQKDALVAGLTNVGLFASHELRSGVPNRADYQEAREAAEPLLRTRGQDLIRGLGYTVTPYGSTANVLSAGGANRAVAVFLDAHEVFDRATDRFNAASPVAQGMAIAAAQNLPWLLITRGTQIRLYPTSPDVGVGRKGQAETYAEVDLALIAQSDAAYLHLIFSAAALADHGSASEILAASADHAAALGARLRTRVYEDVIPELAVAVATEMGGTTEDDLDEAYHRTLTILFRLLFVAYAEDRGLLPYQRNPRYTRKALKTLAREFAEDPTAEFDFDATDRWEDLLAVWRAVDDGNTEWGVPAYNGGLFASDEGNPTGHAIAQITLTNADIGPPLRALLIDTGDDGTLGPVDFRSLSVREFGTIYEGLLESSLSIASTDLTVDRKSKAYLPARRDDRVDITAGQIYFHNASGARKATGSYFTKKFAVEHLLDTALEPAIVAHLNRIEGYRAAGDDAKAAESFFDFRVADLAMGSGHFLVAAIDRIEARLSAYLAGHPVPAVTEELNRLADAASDALGANSADIEIETSGLLRRQIARRCIYGLDLNLMAVELARLGIWIHTFVPGLPMSSLDHGLRVGNSLTGIGTLDEVETILEPAASTGQASLVGDRLETELLTSRDRLLRVARTAEATKREVREAKVEHDKAMHESKFAKALMDGAVAARLGVVALPFDAEAAIQSGNTSAAQEAITDLSATHLPYLFPEVFLRDNPGFDVLLGNPPWEELVYEEIKFWTLHFPGLKGLAQKDQKAAMDRYRTQRPDLAVTVTEEKAEADTVRRALMAGPFPGMGQGHADLYKAFCWRFWELLREGGRAGVVLPRGALSAAGSAPWREEVLSRGSFADVTALINNSGWVFDEVHGQYSLALVTLHRHTVGEHQVSLRGPYHSLRSFEAGMSEAPATFPADQFVTWSTGASFPMLPDTRAGEIFLKYRHHPRFDSTKQWSFKPLQGDFNATTHRAYYNADPNAATSLPVYAGASINLWNPDTGERYGSADANEVLPILQTKRHRQARTTSSAYYGLPASVTNDPNTLSPMLPRIGFRDITNQTNTRTLVTALLPPNIIAVNSLPFLVRAKGGEADEAYLLGVMSSIPMDWYARRYVELHVNFHILNAFPVPRPNIDNPMRRRVIEIAGRLAAVDNRFSDWAQAVGVPVGSVTDELTKSDMICELDAVVSLLYGLDRQDVEHVFATFHRGWAYQDRLNAVLAHYDAWKVRVSA